MASTKSVSTVLIAHFDELERERLRAAFEACGARVSLAADGAAAAASAKQTPFGLALLGCMLPGVSGFELCRELAVATPARAAIPTLLLTDADDPYVRARARHVGAKRVLFGAITTAQARELLATRWDEVDPTQLTSRETVTSKGDRLLRDLLRGGADEGGDSLLAKVTDPLTGLMNAEFLGLKIQDELKRAARYSQPVSLIAAEIARFDQWIEQHGRASGDEALLEVGGVFLCESRDIDVAARVGTARFHLLLPSTPIDGACVVAERLRSSLSERTLTAGDQEVPLEVRVGVTSALGEARLTADEFVQNVERDLATAQLDAEGRSATLRQRISTLPVEPVREATPHTRKR